MCEQISFYFNPLLNDEQRPILCKSRKMKVLLKSEFQSPAILGRCIPIELLVHCDVLIPCRFWQTNRSRTGLAIDRVLIPCHFRQMYSKIEMFSVSIPC